MLRGERRARRTICATDDPCRTRVVADVDVRLRRGSRVLDLDVALHSVGVLITLYSLTHVPRELHGQLLGTVPGRLLPGRAAARHPSARARRGDGVQDDFIGVPMSFSGYHTDKNWRLVQTSSSS